MLREVLSSTIALDPASYGVWVKAEEDSFSEIFHGW